MYLMPRNPRALLPCSLTAFSVYVILKFKDKNPNKTDRSPFSKEEIDALWVQESNIYAQIVLMLIYSGVRVSELLDLKRENVNIEEHCFKVVESKTESGIRVVPIHDRTYPFFKKWYEDGNEYLLQNLVGAVQQAVRLHPRAHIAALRPKLVHHRG